MTAPREPHRSPSSPDRLPSPRGGRPSSQTASAAARPAGLACLALSGSLALPATAEAQTPTCTLNTGDLWCRVVTVEKDSFVYGFLDATTGALSDTGFSVGTNSYTIENVWVAAGLLSFGLTSALTTAGQAKLVLHVVGSAEFAFSAADAGVNNSYRWMNSGLDWSSTSSVTLRLRDATASTNNAPAFTSSTTFNPAENQTTVGTVAASDSDMGDEVTGYVLSGGADQALFAIDGTSGALTFQTAPNYEDPQDTDNAYLVEVQATSGTGDREQTGTQTITVTVMNADEGQTGTVSIDDTAPMVDDALTASTADVADPDGLPDPFAPTWQWYSTPAGGAETVISGATSATYTVVAADLGAALTAKARWTDVGGFANTLASAPTNAVTATDSGTLPELRVADASATEGEDVTFTVTLSAASTQAVTATWTASIGSGDTAVEADLWSPTTGTVSIAAGQTTATFTVPAAEDTADEEDETFTVTLSGVSTNAQLASDPTATGTIIDDDAPPPR